MVSHAFTCNVAAADCAGTPLAPGYVYSGNGCCLCEAGCDHSKETGTSCTYYDTRTIPETCKYPPRSTRSRARRDTSSLP